MVGRPVCTPGASSTVSPALAALMAAWIVAYADGTSSVSALPGLPQARSTAKSATERSAPQTGAPVGTMDLHPQTCPPGNRVSVPWTWGSTKLVFPTRKGQWKLPYVLGDETKFARAAERGATGAAVVEMPGDHCKGGPPAIPGAPLSP